MASIGETASGQIRWLPCFTNGRSEISSCFAFAARRAVNDANREFSSRTEVAYRSIVVLYACDRDDLLHSFRTVQDA